MLKDTFKKSGPINKRLSEFINTIWQQKKLLDKLKDEMGTYDSPQNCQKLATKKQLRNVERAPSEQTQ